MSKPWPPPPDLASIQELVAAADPEGFIADGSPPDEYEPEAELLLVSLSTLLTQQLVVRNVLPVIEEIWRTGFNLDDEGLEERRPALTGLAMQIERFFGPLAAPLVRSH